MIYGYVRVSTKHQANGFSIEDQKSTILNLYPNAKIYIEIFSGAKERPIFKKLIRKLNSNDILVTTTLDRFCRSTKEGLECIKKLKAAHVKIHILNIGLIEDNPIGELIITILLAYAQYERNIIFERTSSGKALARLKEGFREGRPPIYTQEEINQALDLLKNHTYTSVVNMTGISKSTLIRAKKLYS